MKRLFLALPLAAVLILAWHGSSRAQATQYFGVYRATVLSNADPEQRYRLQVDVPAVPAASGEWAMPSIPYPTGTVVLPPVGALVWVQFEGGDPSYPLWTGWAPRTRLEIPSTESR